MEDHIFKLLYHKVFTNIFKNNDMNLSTQPLCEEKNPKQTHYMVMTIFNTINDNFQRRQVIFIFNASLKNFSIV